MKGGVCDLPEALGVEQNTQLPHNEGEDCHRPEGNGVKAPYEYHRREHHQMIPVEYAAGGTALCAHHQSEGTPDEYAYKITYVEKDGDHKQSDLADDTVEIQNSDNGDKSGPQYHHHISRGGGGGYVFFESLAVYFFTYRLESVGKKLL